MSVVIGGVFTVLFAIAAVQAVLVQTQARIDAQTAEAWGWVNRALPPDDLWPFVDRLVARIASFPAHAVAAAKASTLRSEHHLRADLLDEAEAFNGTLGHPETRAALERFLADGGQTRDGELDLAALFDPPTPDA